MERKTFSLLVIVSFLGEAVGGRSRIGWEAHVWNSTNLWSDNTNYYQSQDEHYPHEGETPHYWHTDEPANTRNWTNYTSDTKVLLVSSKHNPPGDDGWGVREGYDKIIYCNMVKMEESLGKEVIKTVSFPPKGVKPLGMITFIKIFGLKTHITPWGGTAELLSGGIGKWNAELRLIAKDTKEFNFRIYVYGYTKVLSRAISGCSD